MKSPTLPATSKVTQAQQHLTQAIERLERALAARADAAVPPPVADDETVSRLKAENDALKAANRAVTGRLDETIGRLKRLLDA